jgi:C4-dicarboxylate transporter, DctQ subunit
MTERQSSGLLGLVHRIEDGLLVFTLLAMVVLAGLDIVARSVFGGGILWIPPLLRVMVLWLGLMGAVLATRSREHISIDLVNRLASKSVSRWISMVTSAFAAVICAIIAGNATRFVIVAQDFGDMAFGNIPAWPLQIIIPLSFGLMALRFAIQSVQAALNRIPEAD